jgi:hypothetical protein
MYERQKERCIVEKRAKRERHTIHPMRLARIRRKQPIHKHLHARHAQALAPAILLLCKAFAVRRCFRVRPIGPSTGIEQHRNEEEIEQTAGDLEVVDGRGLGAPGGDERCDPGAAGVQVAPAAVGRDLQARE